MPKHIDLAGTTQSILQLGSRFVSGVKTLRFNNGFQGDLSANPTSNRVWTLPDKSGTMALLDDIVNSPTVFLDCGIAPNVDGTMRYTCQPGFNKVPVFDVVSNTHPDNLNNSEFTIPITGIYLIYSKIRPLDTFGNVTPISYGQGVHAAAIDASWFIWGNTYSGSNPNRNGLQNTRIVNIPSGTNMFLYSFFPGGTDISASQLNIMLLKAT